MADEQRDLNQIRVSRAQLLAYLSFLQQAQLPDSVQAVNININRGIGEGGGGGEAYSNGGFGAVPASSEAIAALMETTVGETKEKTCAVCLEDFEEGERLKRMPCSHGFHASCISDWLRLSRLCPHCRFALPAQKDSEQKDATEA
ncbi:E3 ubiquitin-protein ligase SIRP1-like [Oryza brachyantha]|nr:E3 ubiquitin-protein ligase SIRP1-like [Oryza brachyantha]